MQTKVRLFINLVQSVLLLEYESWYDRETTSERFHQFEGKASNRVKKIRTQDRVRDDNIRKTIVPYVDELMKGKKIVWIIFYAN